MKFIVITSGDMLVSQHREWPAAVDAASRIANMNADCPVHVYCRMDTDDWLFSTAVRAPVAGGSGGHCIRTEFTPESLPHRYRVGSREYIVAARHLGIDPVTMFPAGDPDSDI